ncbi:AAA family ATPase [Hyphomicrobium sp. CS1GBMeth3]|uniref:AAA family ATPase n=1 Tax=Hyphomicrobium sp. CS1GBMeth3 TaxID=1892845 RepID=UPI000A6CBB3C|nr:AAA family ATPase [Hyphomicrobium sp. CS1GBMeth3]
MTTSTKTAALKMAKRGFRVFPIIPDTKIPFVNEKSPDFKKLNDNEKAWSRKHPSLCGGIHLASKEPEVIKRWFAEVPSMNYGVSGQGLCILDVDTKNNKPGIEELCELGDIPETFKVATPLGGLHIYFASESVGQRNIRPSIEIRSKGGYVVGPGSVFAGKKYVVIADRKVAELPEHIRFELAKTPTRDTNAATAVAALDTDAAIENAIAFLQLEPGVEADRNVTAYRIACQLKDIGLSPAMIASVMMEHWNDKNDEPLEASEIETVAHNAHQYGRHSAGSSNPEVEFGDIFRELPKVLKDLQRLPYESRCFADIEPQAIRWLWEDRIALGKLTQLAGIPKVGKSQCTADIAARVTTGGQWPDGGTAPSGSVILITGEDDAADTIRPRFDAAGADVQRIHSFDWALVESGKREQFHVERHAPALRRMIQDIGDVRLVVIDPIPAYMSGDDTHKTGEVRSALLPLQNLAAEEGVAVVLVNHLNKNSKEKSAINRVGGSGAFVAVCRSNWLVALDPEDEREPHQQLRLLLPIGSNIGRDAGGLAFHVEDVVLPGGIKTSRLRFQPARVTRSADDVLAAVSDGAGGAVLEAEAFLRRELAGGECPSKVVMSHATHLGIAPATLSRAKARLKVTAVKQGKDWFMRLPPIARPDPAEEFGDIFK